MRSLSSAIAGGDRTEMDATDADDWGTDGFSLAGMEVLDGGWQMLDG